MKNARKSIVICCSLLISGLLLNMFVRNSYEVKPLSVSEGMIYRSLRREVQKRADSNPRNSTIKLNTIEQLNVFMPNSRNPILVKAVEKGWKMLVQYCSKDSFKITIRHNDESYCFDQDGFPCSKDHLPSLLKVSAAHYPSSRQFGEPLIGPR